MRDIPEGDTLDVDVQRLRELLSALGRRRPLRDPISSTMEEMGLTPPQLHALLWLGGDGPLTMGELARRIGSTEKTVTGVVDRLERDGHLNRERDEQDRRVVRARLTRQGTTVFRKLDAQMDVKLRQMLGLLDTADRRDLFRIFDNLVSKVASLDEALAHTKESGK